MRSCPTEEATPPEMDWFVVMDTGKGLSFDSSGGGQHQLHLQPPSSAIAASPPDTLALRRSASAEILRRTRPPLGLKSLNQSVDVPHS